MHYSSKPIISLATTFLLLVSMSAHSALVNIYDADEFIISISQTEDIVARASGPDTTFNTDIFNFENNFPDAPDGSPNNRTFVLLASGIVNTSLYSSLRVRHDDGFLLSVGPSSIRFDGNTRPRLSEWLLLDDEGEKEFDLTYWENTGAETLQIEGILRSTGAIEFASLLDPIVIPDGSVTVSEPANLALLIIGLGGLGFVRRQQQLHRQEGRRQQTGRLLPAKV